MTASSGIRRVEGAPYSAEFLPQENASEGVSFATVIFQPPFIFGEDKLWLSTELQDEHGGLDISHMLTTTSKTVTEISVETDGSTEGIHEARMDMAYEAAQRVVALLNRIENGTYKEGTEE